MLFGGRMRRIFVFLALLAGGCPGGNVAPGSQPDNCTAGTATLTSLAIQNSGAASPAAVGDRWIPGFGGQGLTMAHFDLVLTGDFVPNCVNINARAENAIFDGNSDVRLTATGGTVEPVPRS